MTAMNRRAALAALAAAAAAHGAPAWAKADPIEIGWEDLVPNGGGMLYQSLRTLGVIQHGEMSNVFDQEEAAALTEEYNDKRVRLPGFVIPLDYSGLGAVTMLLVPYVGACIHVPPPPPNQIVIVTALEPYEVRGFFEPVYVEGPLETQSVATGLAEVGYVIAAAEITPYEE